MFQDVAAQGEQVYVIPFLKNKADVLEIDAEINGYKSKFIFDPGASLISFPVRLFFLIFGSSDVQSSAVYKTKTKLANGTLADAYVINLKKVVLGTFELKDVEALVVEAADAPCLIGQNLLQNFSSVTIDNNYNQIILRKRLSTSMVQLKELRFIPCSSNVLTAVGKIRDSINSSGSFSIERITQEEKFPPREAIERISKDITIRYFDNSDGDKASFLQNFFQGLGYSSNRILKESMTKYYRKGIPGYIEIWFKF
ncbi:MAG: hypothetical protein JWQ40_5040 [Segetibacter sp.]|nr:hypothetical protein [Segetibacter sp.]